MEQYGGTVDIYELWFRTSTQGEWVCASGENGVRSTAVKKKHLLPQTTYAFRVRAHLPTSGWGEYSNEVAATTLGLQDSIKIVRRKVKEALYRATGVAPAPPLPTTSHPHYPMPRFPMVVPPAAALSASEESFLQMSASTDNRRVGLCIRRARKSQTKQTEAPFFKMVPKNLGAG